MPPKAKDSPEVTALVAQFESFGLSNAKAIEVARNSKQANAFQEYLAAQKIPESSVNGKQANLLLQVATSSEALSEEGTGLVTKEILDERLLSTDQVTGRQGCCVCTFVY